MLCIEGKKRGKSLHEGSGSNIDVDVHWWVERKVSLHLRIFMSRTEYEHTILIANQSYE